MISDNGHKGAADADVGTNVSGGQTSIPRAAVTDGAPEPDASGDGEAVGLININTAAAAELETLPGIGDVLAGRIIEYRELNGGFQSIEEIMAVSGIGEKKFGDIKDRITVG
jgi:competence protein ComEA